MCGEDALTGVGTGGSSYDTDNLNFAGVPYGPNDFNDYRCGSQNGLINNYGDPNEVRNCRLVGLTDLDQSKSSVRQKIADYMNDLIDIGVAGFRVDASKHMWPEENEQLYSLLHNLNTAQGFPAATKPWLGQEVIDQGGEPIKKEEYIGMGTVTEFNYCFSLANLQGSLVSLRTVADNPGAWGFLSDKNAFVFVNNHDNQRGHGGGGGIVTFEDPHGLKVTTGMMMALPYGTKRIMSSYAFSTGDDGPPLTQPSTADSASGKCSNGWICEHRWPGIRNLGMLSGALRKETGAAGYTNWWDNGSSQISFGGGEGFFAINNDAWTMDGGVQTGLPAGKYCNLAVSDIDGCTSTIDVDSNGLACVTLDGGDDLMAYTILEAKVGEYTQINDCKDLASGPIAECEDCNCPDNKKLDCGFMGVDATQCVAKGCAWCPTSKRGVPWCIWLAEGSTPAPPGDGGNGGNGGNGGGSCPPTHGREDCGHMGITEGECIRKGCVWCPAFLKDDTTEMDVPWCTYGISTTQAPTQSPTTQTTTHSTPNTPEPLVCSDPDRDECGWSGMTPQECLDEGCVWCPYSGHRAHCSHMMSTTTTDGPDTTTTTEAVTTDGPTAGPTEPGETTTTKKPPSGGDGELCLETQQCPPPPANCNIPDLIDREDCGELASTPTTCIASG